MMAGGVPGRMHEGEVEWGGHTIHLEQLQMKHFVDYRTPARDYPVVDEAGLRRFIEVARGYDLVFCESPEAMILHAAWMADGGSPVAVCALEVQALRAVDSLRRWYETNEGRDPWPATVACPWISWVVNTRGLTAKLIEEGVPESRIFDFPTSSEAFVLLLPDAERLLDRERELDSALTDGLPLGEVLVAGSGQRDRIIALEVARSLPEVPFVVVDEHVERHRDLLQRHGLANLANVRWLAPQPVERFITLIRRSRAVLVALLEGPEAGGQMTVALAHRLGVPVVGTAAAGVAGYVEHDKTGLLVAPGDREGLAAAVQRLWCDEDLERRLCAAGREVERGRTDATRAGGLRAFEAALSAAAAAA